MDGTAASAGAPTATAAAAAPTETAVACSTARGDGGLDGINSLGVRLVEASAHKRPPRPSVRITAARRSAWRRVGKSQLPWQECDGYFNPAPQYSSSNRTLHYGGKILCNFSASYLHFAVNLYTVTGSGDNIEYNFQEQLIKNGRRAGPVDKGHAA